MKKRLLPLVIPTIFLLFVFVHAGSASAQQLKIATINIQSILAKSKSGQQAQATLEKKISELQTKFQKEQEELESMKEEIEKKSSSAIWSPEVKSKKEREFQKKFREFQVKSEDAKFEMNQLEKKLLEPIYKDLNEIIAEVGKRDDYSFIWDYSLQGLKSRTGLVFAADAVDISDVILKEFDKRQAKKK